MSGTQIFCVETAVQVKNRFYQGRFVPFFYRTSQWPDISFSALFHHVYLPVLYFLHACLSSTRKTVCDVGTFQQVTWCHISKDSNLSSYRHWNLKCHITFWIVITGWHQFLKLHHCFFLPKLHTSKQTSGIILKCLVSQVTTYCMLVRKYILIFYGKVLSTSLLTAICQTLYSRKTQEQ